MNGRPLTDAQVSKALRAHLPEAAYPGLRERVLEAAVTTAQLRPFPLFLGALSEADPIGRRRSLLIAAVLLLALAVASAAAVGAWRLLQRDPIDQLSLEPPADVPAFVLSSYERLPQLPPVAFTWHQSSASPADEPAKGRVYVDRSGTVRFDRFTSADATEPSSSTILNANHRISGVAPVDSEAVWIEQGHEAIGDDPRVFLRGILGVGPGPGCEMARDQSEDGSANVATGWRYVGVEDVVGRPTHRVACLGEVGLDSDLWIDIETRLILRTREPLTDDEGRLVPGQFSGTEVTEIAFGEQSPSLFEPPDGMARISADAYNDYYCTRGLPNELMPGISDCPSDEAEATQPPESSPTPMPSERPTMNECAVQPGDPSQPIGPLAWSPESLNEDWPAPVRPEPAGGRGVQPMPLTYLDPTGDNGSDVFPCADIRAVMADTSEVHLELESGQPVVDPAEQWIAYGVVTDNDRDGVPDWRYGIDNDPAFGTEVPGDLASRWWRTDLHTGRTVAGGMDVRGSGNWLGADFKSVYPSGSDASFLFGGAYDTTQGLVPWGFELDMPFYTWASVIVNGRVVATDYAPDAGWLVATADLESGDVTQPGDTTTPGGTDQVEGPFPVRLSMTLPDGWTEEAQRRFYHARHVTRDDGSSGLRFVMVDPTTEDAFCAQRPGAVDGRATVDDLVAFLGTLPLIHISRTTDVTLDGYRGRYVEFARTAGEIDCGWGGIDGWVASSPSARDEVDRVWILDVGGAPLVIDAFAPPEASDALWAELRHIVESMRIDP